MIKDARSLAPDAGPIEVYRRGNPVEDQIAIAGDFRLNTQVYGGKPPLGMGGTQVKVLVHGSGEAPTPARGNETCAVKISSKPLRQWRFVVLKPYHTGMPLASYLQIDRLSTSIRTGAFRTRAASISGPCITFGSPKRNLSINLCPWIARPEVCQPALGKEKGPVGNPADPWKIKNLQAIGYCG
jgi:hypothetical protein